MVKIRRKRAVPAVMTVPDRFPTVQWQWLLFLLTVLLLWPSSVPAYDYPLDNPYAATIVGTPKDLQVELPKKIREKELKLSPLAGRKLPGLFWYQQAFRYSLAHQKHKAPLIFVIAGTGASYKSPKMQMMKRAFYQAGFHVVCLTSPTYANFIVTASGSGMPGNIRDDSADLYQVMNRIWQEIGEQVEVSEFFLTGYSLGGAQAAFISQLDEEQKRFNFHKILMINPPLSLFSSVGILDAMLEENIPGGAGNFNNFFDKMMAEFSAVYKESDWLNFDNTFLYRVYQRGNSSDADMMALIGLSFRVAAGDMIFTADVMNNAGYILPQNLALTSTDSTTDYAKVAFRTSFLNYFEDLFLPFFQSREPGLSRQELIDRQSLASIEGYLASNEKIGMLHNADDVILAPGELDYLVRLLGSRAKVYPVGGHCGNMEHRQNVKDMVEFFLP